MLFYCWGVLLGLVGVDVCFWCNWRVQRVFMLQNIFRLKLPSVVRAHLDTFSCVTT